MSDWIYGRHAVLECLRAEKRSFHLLRVAEDLKASNTLDAIIGKAKQLNLDIERVKRATLSKLGENHQGLALKTSDYPYADLGEMLLKAKERNEDPFLLLLDTLQDPQNLGTLIRTAEAAGVHGVIIPSRRSASVTPAVVNASSGASEHLLIGQHNLAQSIDLLKSEDVWIIGLEGGPKSQAIDQVNLKGAIALVVGSEGKGMRKLVSESCDLRVRLPMHGKIESLNAAVAGSIVLYMVEQARRLGK